MTRKRADASRAVHDGADGLNRMGRRFGPFGGDNPGGAGLPGGAVGGEKVAQSHGKFAAIADHAGRRKVWVFWCSILTVITTAFLWFAEPNSSHVILILIAVVIANIGFEVGQVFYNALLPSVAPSEKLGRVSGWAWG